MSEPLNDERRDEAIFISDSNVWGNINWPFSKFDAISLDIILQFKTIILAPRRSVDLGHCENVLAWKARGLLGDRKIFFAAFYGRSLCSPEYDALVYRWVVHARSEREVLNSDKLVYLPYCQRTPPATRIADDGYLFAGGRTFRQFDGAVAGMSRSGIPGVVISDLAPEGGFPGVEIIRQHVPGEEYIDRMARARVVLIPLRRMPISHGHRDVVTAIQLGKPVVVTGGASCEDYVQHGVNGLLVPENTPEAWEHAIRIAHDRADEFAEASRRLALLYGMDRYSGYVQEILDHPDRHLVRPDPVRAAAQAPRSEWEHMRQENFHRKMKGEHRAALDEARALLKGRDYPACLKAVEGCINGPFRSIAIQVKKTAMMRIDPAGSEEVIRVIIEEFGPTAELRTDLATSLAAQERLPEALAEAEAAVAMDPDRNTSINYLAKLRSAMEKA